MIKTRLGCGDLEWLKRIAYCFHELLLSCD
jgi:hypothetical protein